MKARDIIAIVGGFFTSFGSVLMMNEVPKWAWWTGQAMVILGPLLMVARASMAGKDIDNSSEKPTDKAP